MKIAATLQKWTGVTGEIYVPTESAVYLHALRWYKSGNDANKSTN